MSPLFSLILGALQGVTEFLPVSSSGHLVLAQTFLASYLGALEAPLEYDVLLHLATLLVVLAFLRADIVSTIRTIFLRDERGVRARHLTFLVGLGTLPAAIVVLFLKSQIEEAFHSVEVAGVGFLITSFLLESAHRKQKEGPKIVSLSMEGWELPSPKQAILIGCAQALSVTPGVSRSGSTIGMALYLGLPAESAVRFSFFLFIPAVLGASVLQLGSLADLSSDNLLAYGLGFSVAVIVGALSLRILLAMVQSVRLRVFAIYTFFLGLAVLLLSSFA
jgi:undecaprenyl-diphosphatase